MQALSLIVLVLEAVAAAVVGFGQRQGTAVPLTLVGQRIDARQCVDGGVVLPPTYNLVMPTPRELKEWPAAKPLEKDFVDAGVLTMQAAKHRLKQRVVVVSTAPVTSPCMARGSQYTEQLARIANQQTSAGGNGHLAWTILDNSYANMVQDVVHMMHRIGYPTKRLAFGCLDTVALEAVCATDAGSQAFLFPTGNSLTRVADAKFGIATSLLQAGLDFLFYEMDVWFVRSPAPLFIDKHVELFVSVHQDNGYSTNIGIYFVRATNHTTNLFTALAQIKRKRPKLFDQRIFDCYLKSTTQHRNNRLVLFKSECDSHLPPAVEMGLGRDSYDFNLKWRSLKPNVIVASAAPVVFPGTVVAVHVLTSHPLTGAAGKKWIAKEMGLWEGSERYYDDPAARYLSYDGPIAQNSDWLYEKGEGVGKLLAYLVAIAFVTNRTLVLPSLMSNAGLPIYTGAMLDVERMDARFNRHFNEAAMAEGAVGAVPGMPKGLMSTPNSVPSNGTTGIDIRSGRGGSGSGRGRGRGRGRGGRRVWWRESSFLQQHRTRICGGAAQLVIGHSDVAVRGLKVVGGGGAHGPLLRKDRRRGTGVEGRALDAGPKSASRRITGSEDSAPPWLKGGGGGDAGDAGDAGEEESEGHASGGFAQHLMEQGAGSGTGTVFQPAGKWTVRQYMESAVDGTDERQLVQDETMRQSERMNQARKQKKGAKKELGAWKEQEQDSSGLWGVFEQPVVRDPQLLSIRLQFIEEGNALAYMPSKSMLSQLWKREGMWLGTSNDAANDKDDAVIRICTDWERAEVLQADSRCGS
jgi:hypothetical protein